MVKKAKVLPAFIMPVAALALLLSPVQGLGHTASAASVSVAPLAFAAASADAKVEVDGKKLSLSPSAFTKDGVTYVPMRPIFTALGATVAWEPSTKTIIAIGNETTVTLTLGKTLANVNGKSVRLDAAPLEKNGTTFVPARFVAESFDAKVKWDGKAQTVRITSLEARLNEEAEQWVKEQEERDKKLEQSKMTAQQIVDRYDASVVMIETDRGQGSGVVIGDRWILTNYHVMNNAKSATAFSVYGEELKVEGVAASDERTDLAIIQTKESMEELSIEPVKVGIDYRAKKGDAVVAIGSPLGVQNTVSEGLISNVSVEGGVSYIQTNAPIDHGSSGGALFNLYGQLIGITSSGFESEAHLNFAVSATNAALLMGRLPKEPAADVSFLPSTLPDTLEGQSTDAILKVIKDNYGSVATTEGEAKFTDWKVTRDANDWLVITANIDPVFYTYYIDSVKDELRLWAVNAGHELHDLLPGETIQFQLYYDRVFGFEPRGFEDGEVTETGDGKWRVRFPVLDMQLKDQLYIEMRD